MLKGVGRVDLIAEDMSDRFRVYTTASITSCSRMGSSTAPPVRYLKAATGSAVLSRSATSSTNLASGLAGSAVADGAGIPPGMTSNAAATAKAAVIRVRQACIEVKSEVLQ